MLISIIIPAYNVEDYLRCCIDSVLTALDQSCMTEAAEILLVIGQSKDRTDFLCRYYETLSTDPRDTAEWLRSFQCKKLRTGGRARSLYCISGR